MRQFQKHCEKENQIPILSKVFGKSKYPNVKVDVLLILAQFLVSTFFYLTL